MLFEFGVLSDARSVRPCKGQPIGRYAQLGTFLEHILCHENSLIRVEPDLPMEAVALVSCGVATGLGAATARAGTKPGDTVAVTAIGALGLTAVQGPGSTGSRTCREGGIQKLQHS